MFAASLPISIAGWGVREISSVVALSAVGVDPAAALVTSVLIGIGSMSVVAVLAGLSLASSRQKAASVTAAPRTAIDYAHLLSIAVPLAVAVLIFFQVHIPVGTGSLNVNLAAPFARSEAHTSEIQSLMRKSYDVFCM